MDISWNIYIKITSHDWKDFLKEFWYFRLVKRGQSKSRRLTCTDMAVEEWRLHRHWVCWGLFLPTWSRLLRHHTACLRWLCRRWRSCSEKNNSSGHLGFSENAPHPTISDHYVDITWLSIIFTLYIGGNYSVAQASPGPLLEPLESPKFTSSSPSIGAPWGTNWGKHLGIFSGMKLATLSG